MPVSVVVPTRNRARYLEVALASLRAQRGVPAPELVVVDDGSTDDTRAVAAAHGARVEPVRGAGLNAARNTGVATTSGDVVAFVDDDVWVPPDWLAAVAAGAEEHPGADAFGGPIHVRLEGPAPAGWREAPPITALDLGDSDRTADMVWGANFAVRRSAFERLGGFDEAIGGHGDEEEWLLSLQRSGGRIVYLAGAGLDHRRAGDDSRLRPLMRAAWQRGRGARRTDERRGAAPPVARELRDVGGCLWHAARHVSPQGFVMAAHSAGRLRQGLQR